MCVKTGWESRTNQMVNWSAEEKKMVTNVWCLFLCLKLWLSWIFLYGGFFLRAVRKRTTCLVVPCGERFWWMWNMCMSAVYVCSFFSRLVMCMNVLSCSARAFQLVSYYSFIHIVCPIELLLLLWTQLSTTAYSLVWFQHGIQIIRRIWCQSSALSLSLS